MTNKELQLERLNAILKLIIEKDENNQFHMEVWGVSDPVHKDVAVLVINEVEYLHSATNYLGLSYALTKALFFCLKFNFDDLSISWINVKFNSVNIKGENQEVICRIKQLIEIISNTDEDILINEGLVNYRKDSGYEY